MNQSNILSTTHSLKLLAKIIILFFIILNLTACAVKPYRVAIITNLYSDQIRVGTEGIKAIRLAYENYKHLKPKSSDFEITVLNDGFNPTKTKSLLQLYRDEFDIVIPITTTLSLNAIYYDIINSKSLFFTVSMSNMIDDKKDNLVNFYPGVKKEQEFAASVLNKNGSLKTLLIYENRFNMNYINNSIEYLRSAFHGEIEIQEFDIQENNINRVVKYAKNSNADHIYMILPAYPRETGFIIQKIRQSGNKKPIITAPICSGRLMINSAGAYTDNLYCIGPINNIEGLSNYHEFIDQYKESWGELFDYKSTVLFYDLALKVFDTVDRSGLSSVDRIIENLNKKTDLPVIGNYLFSESGDNSGELYLFKIEKGQYVSVQ